MTPHDPLEERLQGIERRVTDVEHGPYYCTECGAQYPSSTAAERCAIEDAKPDPR